jgi:hypothetical protein
VILFHDHQYIKAGSGDLEHIHIPYGDPSYGGRHLDLHKKRINEMLQTNGKYWLDIITYTRGKLFLTTAYFILLIINIRSP